MRKNKKFALGFKIATLLTCITLVSVGFASWLIVKQPTEQSQTGTVSAFAVSDIGLDVELKDSGSTALIVFGLEKDVTEKWLMAKDVELQDLTATFDLTLKATDIVNIDFDLTVNFAENSGKLAELITAEILTLNVQVYKDTTSVGSSISTLAEDSNTITFKKEDLTSCFGAANDEGVSTANLTVKVEFNWGEKLNSQNPYRFYNGFEYDADENIQENPFKTEYRYGKVEDSEEDATKVQDVAKNVLTAIHGLNNATYTLTVKGTVTPAAAQE